MKNVNAWESQKTSTELYYFSWLEDKQRMKIIRQIPDVLAKVIHRLILKMNILQMIVKTDGK